MSQQIDLIQDNSIEVLPLLVSISDVTWKPEIKEATKHMMFLKKECTLLGVHRTVVENALSVCERISTHPHLTYFKIA